MLGINTPGDRVPRPYRNYAAVTPGDPVFLGLEALGAVERYAPRLPSEYHYYRCTEAGRLAALRSHRDIRYPKSRRRYLKYLEMRDAWQGLTFREVLVNPEFQRARTEA